MAAIHSEDPRGRRIPDGQLGPATIIAEHRRRGKTNPNRRDAVSAWAMSFRREFLRGPMASLNVLRGERAFYLSTLCL